MEKKTEAFLHNDSGDRLDHLDSLRGIAAIMVAFHHSFYSFKSIPFNEFLRSTCGRLPVFFFFILSGFVLSRSLQKSKLDIQNLLAYWTRRLFRLYPMVLFGIFLGFFTASYYIIPLDSSPYSYWLNDTIASCVNVKNSHHFYDWLTLRDPSLDRPLWTIRVELQCALILPFIILIARFQKLLLLPLGLFLAIFMQYSDKYAAYMFIFFLGFFISEYHSHIKKITKIQTKILFITTMVFIIAFSGGGANKIATALFVFVLFLVMVPCNWSRLRSVLHARFFRFTGKVSYSFYVIHTPVMLFLFTLIQKTIPNQFIIHYAILSATMLFLISGAVTLFISYFTEKYIEQPTNLVGHLLSKKIRLK